MRCSACDAEIVEESAECPECGERLQRPPEKERKRKLAKVIPYKNLFSLIGYYVGVVALIPGVAAVLGPVAIGLGIAGLVYGGKHPKAKAPGHCMMAIAFGVLGIIGTIIIYVLIKEGYLEWPPKHLRGDG